MAVVCKAAAARVIHCEMVEPPRLGPGSSSSTSSGRPDQVRLVPRSRPYTLRSDASDHRRGGVMKGVMTMMMRSRRRRRRSSDDHQEINGGDELDLDQVEEEELEYMWPVLESMFESIEMSKKSYYFEIVTGRLAMIIFAVTMGVELATGDSILKVIDAQGIAEGILGCLAATTCATFFAPSSATRKKMGQIFTIGCNAFFEALIDNVVDGLLAESDLDEPSDNNFT